MQRQFWHNNMSETIKEEEQTLVHRAVEIEMAELNAGKVKTYSFEDIKKIVEFGR